MRDILIKSLDHYGLTEVPGPGSNPRLLNIIKSELDWVEDDSKIAWCAIYMTHLFRGDVYEDHIPKDPYAARSWLTVGCDIPIELAEAGDIVVLWRNSISDWRGHVGLFINHTEDGRVRLLGGNQSNSVNISIYPESRILSVRRVYITDF